LLDKTLTYWYFADRFGWTPAQVDDLPVAYSDRLMVVGEVRDAVVAEKQRKAQREAG
jgi:hypothetical protein